MTYGVQTVQTSRLVLETREIDFGEAHRCLGMCVAFTQSHSSTSAQDFGYHHLAKLPRLVTLFNGHEKHSHVYWQL